MINSLINIACLVFLLFFLYSIATFLNVIILPELRLKNKTIKVIAILIPFLAVLFFMVQIVVECVEDTNN